MPDVTRLLALALAVLFLLGSDCEEQRLDDLDEGFRNVGELEIHPEVIPMAVEGDSSLDDEGLAPLVPAVVAWWNDQIGDDEDWFYEAMGAPDITVEVNYISLDSMPDDFLAIEHDVDLAEIHYSTYDGAVISCHCILNVDLAYDYDTMEQGLRHCLGHCLGLEDDPGIDVTVDLRSIMSNPLDPLGELTDHDRELLLGAIEEADDA
jgi:hypothetical protein